MPDEAVTRILERLSAIDSKLEAQAENVERFWQRDFPRLEEQIGDHERRIRVLEGIMSDIPTLRADMRRLTEALRAEARKTDDLEKFRTKIVAYWAATVAIAGLSAGFFVWIAERFVLPGIGG